MTLKKVKETFDKTLGNPHHIGPEHVEIFSRCIDRDSALAIIDDLLADDALLTEIAGRSYGHVMGFKKIKILDEKRKQADGALKQAYELRLHIWEPVSEDSKSYYLEMLHRHGFNFASRVLTGGMENQCYKVLPLSTDEENVLEKVKTKMNDLERGDVVRVDEDLETLATLKLTDFGSQQAAHLGLSGEFNVKKEIADTLALTPEEVDLLLNVQGFHGATALNRNEGGYSHVHLGDVSITPHDVLCLNAGDVYYHPRSVIHRLYNPGHRANSTMLLTTPAEDGAVDGSFGRITFIKDDNKNFTRKMYKPEELRDILTTYRKQLAEEWVKDHKRRFIVPEAPHHQGALPT